MSFEWVFTILSIETYLVEDLKDDLTGPLSSVGAHKPAKRVEKKKKKKKSDGVLQRLQAFILFKTTDSTNHAFD